MLFCTVPPQGELQGRYVVQEINRTRSWREALDAMRRVALLMEEAYQRMKEKEKEHVAATERGQTEGDG